MEPTLTHADLTPLPLHLRCPTPFPRCLGSVPPLPLCFFREHLPCRLPVSLGPCTIEARSDCEETFFKAMTMGAEQGWQKLSSGERKALGNKHRNVTQTTIKYHYTPTKMAIIKKTDNRARYGGTHL